LRQKSWVAAPSTAMTQSSDAAAFVRHDGHGLRLRRLFIIEPLIPDLL
jgi:hypothetical protein